MAAFIEKTLNGIAYWEMQCSEVESDTPITLALHYMTGDAAAMGFVFDGFDRPMRVVSLQGQYPSGDAAGGYSWYPDELAFYDRSEAGQAPDIRRQTDRAAELLMQLKSVTLVKTAVVGMSQGGDLTLGLAAYYPELMDLAIPCAGRLSPPMRPSRLDKPQHILPGVLVQQGVDDPIVSVASAREAAKWLTSVGYNAELHEYPNTGHVLSKEMIVCIQQVLATL